MSLLRPLPPAGLRGPALEGLPPLFKTRPLRPRPSSWRPRPPSSADVSTANSAGVRLRPTTFGIVPRLSSMILTAGLIRDPQLLLLQPQKFAGRLPPGRASNRNQKKNGRGLRPLRVLYMGPFLGPLLLPRPPPHVCSVLVVCPLLPSSVATRPQLLLTPRLEKGYLHVI